IPYWTILLGIVLACSAIGLATGKWLALAPFATYSPDVNGIAGTAAATFSNLTGFGIDWFCFLAHEPACGPEVTADGLNIAHPLCRYIVINPAWSIGVELTFYLFVPWFNRCSTKMLALLTAVSLGARIVAYENFGLMYDPWTYRFTPFAMALFLTGMICCRLTRSSEPSIVRFVNERLPTVFRKYSVQVGCLLTLFWLGQHSTQVLTGAIPVRYADLISYLGWATVIPMAFAVTKTNKLDRWLGELSYPVYLVHYFIVSIIAAVYTRVLWLPVNAKAAIVASLSIVLSLVILKWVVAPVELRRRRWARMIAAQKSPPTTVYAGKLEPIDITESEVAA
ncbi:MAG: hypothetical protein P8J37_12840, partial [Fuerstiella sp.]|nr:hypothetical protein [Fuerstiella sp.]